MPRFNLLSFTLSLLLSLPSIHAAAPIVDLGYSKYQGYVDASTSNTHFYGIRYAQPPLGSLRFKAPQTPASTTGIINATTQGPECLQVSFGTASASPFRNSTASKRGSVSSSDFDKRSNFPVSEDCLFLDVYVPGTLDPTKKLPVIVWIHGGGYLFGGSQGIADLTLAQRGDDLIRWAKGGVVVVQIQYRLGVFGFLAGSDVKANGALNAGLLDQEFSFKWVQKYISKFGGDPTKVTIWGESAGAGSVMQHMIARNGATTPPLFRAGISSSSFIPSQYPYNHVVPETLYKQVLAQTGCTTFACLQTVDANTLNGANFAINGQQFFGTFVFVPVIDGTFVTQRPSTAFATGKFNGGAFLSVTNTNEGPMFVNPGYTDSVDVAEYIRNLFPYLAEAKVQAAKTLYGTAGIGGNYAQVNQIMTDSIFVCPQYWMLAAWKKSPAYRGQFAIPPAYHGFDLEYYFPSGSISGTDAPAFNNAQFITAFAGSFVNFATSLNPNVKIDSTSILPTWPGWTLTSPKQMVFNETATNQPDVRLLNTDAGLMLRCAFWATVASQTYQ